MTYIFHVILRERSDRRIPLDFRRIVRPLTKRYSIVLFGRVAQYDIKSIQPPTFQPFNSPHTSHFTFHFSDPSPEFVSSHLLTNKFYPLPQGARELFCSKPFIRSTFQPFNSHHSSRFTLHFLPLTRISKFAALIKKFFPLPQGARELFCSKLFIRSTFQPFNPSTLFTLHPSRLTLIRTYRLAVLSPFSTLFTLHSSRLTLSFVLAP